MQVVAVEILGPLPESTAGNSYILVTGDYFTKWIEAYAIPNQEAVTVAQKLVDQMFCRFSPQDQIHSDHGKQFESGVMQEVCKIPWIKKSRISPYHPQCDGLVERTVLSIRKCAWLTMPAFMPAQDILLSFLCFGVRQGCPLTLCMVLKLNNLMPVSMPQQQIMLRRKPIAGFGRSWMQPTISRKPIMTRRYGKPFVTGDLVWLFYPAVPRGHSKKHHHPWSGPYRVIAKLSETDYRVKKMTGQKTVRVVHFDRLKSCDPNTRLDDLLVTPSPTPPPHPPCFLWDGSF